MQIVFVVCNKYLLGSPECTLYSESIFILNKNIVLVPSIPGYGISCYLTFQSDRFSRVSSHILHLIVNVYVTYNRKSNNYIN